MGLPPIQKPVPKSLTCCGLIHESGFSWPGFTSHSAPPPCGRVPPACVHTNYDHWTASQNHWVYQCKSSWQSNISTARVWQTVASTAGEPAVSQQFTVKHWAAAVAKHILVVAGSRRAKSTWILKTATLRRRCCLATPRPSDSTPGT